MMERLRNVGQALSGWIERHAVVSLLLVVAVCFTVYEVDERRDERRDDRTTARLSALIDDEAQEEAEEQIRFATALARTSCEASSDTRAALAALLEAVFAPLPIEPDTDPADRRRLEASNLRRREQLERLRDTTPLPPRCIEILRGDAPIPPTTAPPLAP